MSWEDLESNDIEEHEKKRQEKLIVTAKNYNHCFNTDAGKAVLEHMIENFVMSNETPLNAKNITYEAGYHAGEAGVVKMILNQIKRAQTL